MRIFEYFNLVREESRYDIRNDLTEKKLHMLADDLTLQFANLYRYEELKFSSTMSTEMCLCISLRLWIGWTHVHDTN